MGSVASTVAEVGCRTASWGAASELERSVTTVRDGGTKGAANADMDLTEGAIPNLDTGGNRDADGVAGIVPANMTLPDPKPIGVEFPMRAA
jgi:hypothetical protein